MGRKAKDPALTALAHAGAAIVLPGSVTFPNPVARNVFLLPNKTTWAGRLRINGNQWTVVFSENAELTARLVDAAWLHFFPWRERGPLEPAPVTFNFAKEQALADCAIEPVKKWLASWEEALVTRGFIVARKDLKPRALGTPDAAASKAATLDALLAHVKSLEAKVDQLLLDRARPITVIPDAKWGPLDLMAARAKTTQAPLDRVLEVEHLPLAPGTVTCDIFKPKK
jgi:hypothetical protein